jgi:tRNA modification GTPase
MTTEIRAIHSIESPAGAPGAVSIIRILSDDMDAVCARIGIRAPKVGSITLTRVLDLDDALVARMDVRHLLITPHGGIALTRAISEAIASLGVARSDPSDPLDRYPEARDIHEARMLDALARCASPIGVDLLLDQPERWRAIEHDPDPDLADGAVLSRLIDPPLVVALGSANIGKSSLVNALAGDEVSIVFDHPGTTRDHVGVTLDLAGLVVRWVDAPGFDERGPNTPEMHALRPVLEQADLIVHAIDHDDPGSPLHQDLGSWIPTRIPIVRIALRTDLGAPRAPVDASCSVKRGEGLGSVARAIRESLVPTSVIGDQRAWRFWR